MSDDSGILALLAAGPASAVGLYWLLYRHYRNTDKSHAFERETTVDARPVTGTDRKTGEIKGTRKSGIDGDNVREYRARVERLPVDEERRE
jgi:hypothetical protein